VTAAVGGACSSHNVHGNALELRRDSSASTEASDVISTVPVTLGDFEFPGTNGGLKSRWPPVSVTVTVTIKNVSTHPAALDLLSGNCAVRMRVYRAQDVSRSAGKLTTVEPVFDATQPGYECYVPDLHRTLTAGQSMTLQSGGDGPGIRLRSGKYDLTGIVTVIPPPDTLHKHGPHVVEVPAGSIRVPLPYD
jgi:hypothetical protein